MLIAKNLSIGGIGMLAIYGYGLYASKAKTAQSMQIFSGLVIIGAIATVFFNFGAQQLLQNQLQNAQRLDQSTFTGNSSTSAPSAPGSSSPASATPAPGDSNAKGNGGQQAAGPTEFKAFDNLTVINITQLVISGSLGYLGYNIFKK
jgi:predicted lipid-binding transport protein (Tim44 family)